MKTDHHDGLETIVTEHAGDQVGPVPAHWFAIPKILRPVAKRVRRVGFPPGGRELGPFLGRVHWQLCGDVAERFLEAVRAGVTDPGGIVDAVRAGLAEGPTDEAIRAALRPPSPTYSPESKAIDLEPALDLARWALWWGTLPEAERHWIRYTHHNPGVQRYLDETTPGQRMRQHQRYRVTQEVAALLGDPDTSRAREMVDRWILTGAEPWVPEIRAAAQ